MARTNYDNNSAGSQFFICIGDYAGSLNGKYAAFGDVIEGLDVCLALGKLPVNGETPVDAPVYSSIRVDTFGYDYPEPIKR